jgi:hypothetical protein
MKILVNRIMSKAPKKPISYPLISQLLLCAITLTVSVQSWATLTATADRSAIDSNETLQLTVRLDAQAITSEPDFSILEKDFKIISNNRQQQYSITNGRTESFTDWNLTLAPKRTGRLLVPSIKYKSDISNAIQVTVRKASPSTVSGQPIYTETSTDSAAVYVQQQLLLTHRLFTSIQLTDLSIEELTIPGALIEKISENQFQKRIGNKLHAVVEIQYAIFPQSGGKLDIPAVNFSAFEVPRNRQNSIFSNRGNRIVRSTEAKTIDVMAKPAHIDSDQWMPSSQVQISQQWSNNLDQLVVGEPITRTITITAKGLTGAQIQPLPQQQSRDYKIYPDQAQLDQSISAQGVTGIRSESLALVPNREGQIELPEIAVRWWDTVNQRMQTATLDAIRLEIGPASSNSQTDAGLYLAPIDMADNQSDEDQSTEQQKTSAGAGSSLLMQLSLAINALLLILLAVLLRKRANNKIDDEPDHSGINSPRLKLKQHIKAIEISASKEDFPAVREGILAWGRSAFAGRSIKTLDEISRLCRDDQLTEQFRLLDQSLYNRETNLKADIKLLIRLLKTLDTPAPEDKTSSNGLKPLYPTNNIG